MNSSFSVFTTRVVNMEHQKKKKKRVEILFRLKTLHYFFFGKHMEETGNSKSHPDSAPKL